MGFLAVETSAQYVALQDADLLPSAAVSYAFPRYAAISAKFDRFSISVNAATYSQSSGTVVFEHFST